MPISQRICEKSDALLLMKEGGLADYVRSFGDSSTPISVRDKLLEIKKGLSCSAIETFRIFSETRTYKEKHLEIGDKITLVQRNGKWELYLKHNDIMVRVGRDAADLEALCNEGYLFQPILLNTLFSEQEIRKEKIDTLIRKLSRRYLCHGRLYRFGDHEIWEYAPVGSDYFFIYGKEPKEKEIHISQLASHLKEYRTARKLEYGKY